MDEAAARHVQEQAADRQNLLAPRGLLKFFLLISSNSPVGRGFLRSIFRRLFKDRVPDGAVDAVRLKSHLRLHFDNTSEVKVLVTPNSFDVAERNFLASHLSQPGSTFVDIGANAGLYSVAMIAEQSAIQVVCVEPNPVMLARLNANLRGRNAFESGGAKLHIAECAVGDVEGTAQLAISDRNLGASSIAPDRQIEMSSEELMEVPVRRLDDILEGFGIEKVDAFKVDIEGHEPNALIPFFRDVDPSLFPTAIVMETSHGNAEMRELNELLVACGYTEFGQTKNNVMLRRTTKTNRNASFGGA